MMKLTFGLAAGLALFAAASAQAPIETPSAAALDRDARNWNVLHELYPRRALAAKEEGLVGFEVTLDSAGQPTKCQVTHSSGHKLLDQETCQLITLHAVFKRPAGVSASQTTTTHGVVNWKLPTTPLSAVPARPQRIAASDAPEAMYCKRNPKTGSLVSTERTCMTKADWQRLSDEAKQFWEEMQAKRGTGNQRN